MAVTPKTIYLEPDEEITSVIDKIRKTEFSDIVLVVPKGASISQSVVNLKLIKKKAESLNKVLSIVTGDKVLRTLAEKVGIASAAAVGSLGAVVAPVVAAAASEADPLLNTSEVIFDKEVVPSVVTSEPDELTISEADDTEEAAQEKDELLRDVAANEDEKKPKSLTPQFPWKKVLLFAGIPLVLLLVLAYIYLPRAKATIFMKSQAVPVSVDITGDKSTTLNTDKAEIPTQIVEVDKNGSKSFTATGTKDEGTKATGTVQIHLAPGNTARTWISGTRIHLGSDSSLVYTLDTTVNVVPGALENVSVTAQNSGDKYNGFLNKPFVALNDPDPDITSTTAMAGGTTKNVTVVSQADIDAATASLTKDTTTDAMAEFVSKTSSLKVIDSTKATSTTAITASPALNAEASTFTLTLTVTTKAVAIDTKDIASIIKAEVSRQLGSTKSIIDDGSGSANLQVDSAALDTGKVSGTITATAYVANKLDQDKVKVDLEGLNDTQAMNYLNALDGVESANLSYFPGFIKSFPRIKGNITLVITVSDSSRN